MFTGYAMPVEQAMRRTFPSLNERPRRRYAAAEALKLGHGGIADVAKLLDCHRKTVHRGLEELQSPGVFPPPDRARKNGGAAVPVCHSFPGGTTRS